MRAEKQVLLVDDDPAVRVVWENFLERWELSHAVVASGEEALAAARGTRFQAMITDLTMPGMSGVELIHRIKHEQPALEVIVITGHGTVESAVETMKAGAFDFLTKPVNFNHAELIVRKCLEQASARRENARLRQINRELEALNELKEKFIAITNHELRTPVGVVNNVADLLGPELDGGELAPLVDLLRHASRQLGEIVAQMHEISSAKAGGVVLTPTHFDLLSLCREVEGELALTLQRRGHHIGWQISEQLSVYADRAKFKKVVRELLHNAVKFTRDAGRIEVAGWRDEAGRLRFSVSDTGIGIPEQSLDRIFQLFYEVGDPSHHHTSREEFMGGGMGVGLSIVHDIVAAHQGRVEVDSTPGKGSRFTLILPQDESAHGRESPQRAFA